MFYKSNNSILKNKKSGFFLAAIIILLLCLVTYGDVLTHRFMIDERIYVKSTDTAFAHQRIYLDPSSTVYTKYRKFEDFFRKPMGHHYIPFNYLLNVSLFRLFQTPFPLYLINLLLFYINCGLLFYFVYLISQEFMTALLTSAFFCIHPMTGDILQHITFNIILLQTIFMETGLIALYLYARQNGHVFYYFLSLLMVTLAIFCQETTLLFPLYAAVLLFFLTDLKCRRTIKLVLPFIALSLLLIVLWIRMANPVMHLERLDSLRPHAYWVSCANFSRLFFWYLSNLFVPRNIVFMCNLPSLTNHIWLWDLLFFGFWSGCGLCIFCCFKKSLESFAVLLFLTGFIYAFPASQTRPDMGGVFEPYWLYFSSMGFYLFIVLIFLKLGKYIPKTLFIILLSSIFLYYFVATLKLDYTSRTEESYAENWLREFPGNSIAMNIVASFYYNHKDIEIPSDLIADMLDLTDIYIKEDVPEAIDLIGRISSSSISPVQRQELLYKLASYQCKNGHADECQKMIHRIIDPQKSPETYMQLSYTLYKTEANKAAVSLLKQCLTLYPKYKEPYLLIGVILGNEGHYEDSIHYWKEGLAIDPADVRFIAYIDKARKLMNKGGLN